MSLENILPATITFKQFLDNPTGKGSANLAKRSIIKDGLDALFVRQINDYKGAFEAYPYTYEDGRIMFHVKVPSEDYKHNKIRYDVLIEFANQPGITNLKNRNVRLFSNCFSFIYTYAYVINAMDLMIPEYAARLPKECLTIAPEKRNPVGSLGWEKSLYLAMRYLDFGNALNDKYINKYGKPMNTVVQLDLFRQIADPVKLKAVYEHSAYQQRATHRKPLTAEQKKTKDKMVKDHAKQQKQKMTYMGSKTKVAQTKITAKKAKKAIQPIKPKKKTSGTSTKKK